jgi:hypothetical protein
MIVNFQISDGTHPFPNYQRLIESASCKDEAVYLREIEERNITFAYNMVYITRQACEHFEIFQTPQNEHYPLDNILKRAVEHAVKNKCTRCICGR